MLDSWILMVVIELIMLPFTVRAVLYIKKRGCIDIYDRITNFNLFGFDTEYHHKDNQYDR